MNRASPSSLPRRSSIPPKGSIPPSNRICGHLSRISSLRASSQITSRPYAEGGSSIVRRDSNPTDYMFYRQQWIAAIRNHFQEEVGLLEEAIGLGKEEGLNVDGLVRRTGYLRKELLYRR